MRATAPRGCDFCEELETGYSNVFEFRFRRVVFENDEFAVFGALGSFVAGYLVMIPRVHVQSFAELDLDALGRAFELAESIRRRMARHFGPSMLFEHGSHGAASGGASIDHAHWHIVPTTRPFDLMGDSQTIDLRSPIHLSRYAGAPYVFTYSVLGARILVDPVVPSQFLRRRLAAALGVPDRWDWRAYAGRAELQETLDRLGVVSELGRGESRGELR